METCKLCGESVSIKSDSVNATIGDNRSGLVHAQCRDKAIASAIAAREAEKPKAMKLEERVESYLIECWGMGDNRPHVDEIIAMARVEFETVIGDWKARAEKAEAKLAAIASEPST